VGKSSVRGSVHRTYRNAKSFCYKVTPRGSDLGTPDFTFLLRDITMTGQLKDRVEMTEDAETGISKEEQGVCRPICYFALL
jgi:hypothetical protein